MEADEGGAWVVHGRTGDASVVYCDPDTAWTGPSRIRTAQSEAWLRLVRERPAAQQPDWGDRWLVDQVDADLAEMPGLVTRQEVDALRTSLAEVARGRGLVLQVGDCAEDPMHCGPENVERLARLIDTLADSLSVASGLPVVRVGRVAGQFAKPRSSPVELVDGAVLPVYRGHLVNDPAPTETARRPDPLRMLSCYEAAARASVYLAGRSERGRQRVWTSHEALLLDYELALVRGEPSGEQLLASTHWPWVGDRTRQAGGAHVALLAGLLNPVAAKVGPTTSVDELLTLCAALDPDRMPGRLTLIGRFGADAVTEHLPKLAGAVAAAGHPVVWLCDPMHGNTVRTPTGGKTRLLSAVRREVRAFRDVLGDRARGLHLEAAGERVGECVSDDLGRHEPEGPVTSLCDPRLGPDQAQRVVEGWNR
jgi:3-deoxy-7-phosphoheptulonate synthase